MIFNGFDSQYESQVNIMTY